MSSLILRTMSGGFSRQEQYRTRSGVPLPHLPLRGGRSQAWRVRYAGQNSILVISSYFRASHARGFCGDHFQGFPGGQKFSDHFQVLEMNLVRSSASHIPSRFRLFGLEHVWVFMQPVPPEHLVHIRDGVTNRKSNTKKKA